MICDSRDWFRYCWFATLPAMVIEGKGAVTAMWAASGSMRRFRSEPMSSARADWSW